MSRPISQSVSLVARLRGAAATPVGALVIAFLTWIFAAMDQSLFGYAVPGVMRDFHIGLGAVGTMISASFVFGMLSPPVAGVLLDRFGPRVILALCLGMASILVFAQALAPNVWSFGVLRVLSYAFSAALSPITSALVANTAPPRYKAWFIAILQCAYPLGGFVAAMVFIPLGADGSWRTPFSVALGVLPISIVIYGLMPVSDPALASASAGSRAPLRALFGTRNARTALLCALAFFLYGGAIGGSLFFLPTFFQEQRGYSASQASLIVGLTYAIGAAGYLVAAYVSRTGFGLWRTTLLWSGLGAILFGIAIWMPAHFATDICLFGFEAMFLFGTASILTTYLLELFDEGIRGTAMALCGTTALTGGYIVFPLLTPLAVKAFGWLWAFSLVVVPAAAAVCFVVSRMPRLDSREL
jgi:MFS family permease